MADKFYARSDLTLTKSKKDPKPVLPQGAEMKATDGYTATDLKRLVAQGWLSTSPIPGIPVDEDGEPVVPETAPPAETGVDPHL